MAFVILLFLLSLLSPPPGVEASSIRKHPIRSLERDRLLEEGNGPECEHQPMVRAEDWMTNTLGVSQNRHDWFHNRQPFEPIVGDEQGNLIAGVLFTYSNEILKMTAIFPPLFPEEESRECKVILKSSTNSDNPQEITVSGTIVEETWHCSLRIDALPSDDYDYTVIYEANPASGITYTYEGKVPAPSKEYPRIAAMGCFGPGSSWDKSDLVAATLAQKPDLLVLQGDQSYFHHALSYGSIELVYSINELTRSIPTIVQMDDHDVGEGNFWGAGEGDEESGSGYTAIPVCVINALQQQALSHNPDPVSTENLDNGITVHYTNYIYGKTDFAVLEARKFKNSANGDSLLGTDQEQWLTEWCKTNENHVKVILSQTPFASLETHGTSFVEKPEGGKTKGGIVEKPFGNKDSNGYPIAGRNRFMEIIEGCSPLILSGDQHIGIAVAYENNYGNVMECASPAVINDVWWRVNINEKGAIVEDGFGHPYRLLNAWNVDAKYWDINPSALRSTIQGPERSALAEGFLMVDLDGQKATCEMHGYRNGTEMIWSVEELAASPAQMVAVQ